MQITCIGEGQLMRNLMPRLKFQDFDVRFFSRCGEMRKMMDQKPIKANALPKALADSSCTFLFLDNSSHNKYPLSRQALAAIANQTCVIVHDNLDGLDALKTQLENVRADCFDIRLEGGMPTLNARPDQFRKWNHLIDALCATRTTLLAETVTGENIVPGPWLRPNPTTHTAHRFNRKQPMN